MNDEPTRNTRGGRPAQRGVGRPRRLTLSQILDTAIEMGLDGLRVAALAKRLSVSPAVLYTYVNSRTELVRLAAQRAAGIADFPNDHGQSWREYVIQYAEAHFRLVQDGQLVSTLIHGDMSPASKLDSAEQWVQIMSRHGFSAGDALSLLRSVDVIVLGGALLATYARAVAVTEQGYEELLRATVRQRSADDLPNLTMYIEAYAASASPAWRCALASLLDDVDRRAS